jgi:tRNA(fMet)-specific endonuclease VapC
MSSSGPILLDTNVVLHIVRGSEVARRIDAAIQLRARTERPLISVVTIGEALAFAQRRVWGDQKTSRLEELVRELTVVDVNNATVLRKYALLHTHLKKIGRPVGDNDVWIAACAAAASAILITTDKDFDALHGTHLTRMYFEPSARQWQA